MGFEPDPFGSGSGGASRARPYNGRAECERGVNGCHLVPTPPQTDYPRQGWWVVRWRHRCL